MKELNQHEIEQVSGAFLDKLISDIFSLFFKPPSPMGLEGNGNMAHPVYIVKDGEPLPWGKIEPIAPASLK